MKVRDKEGQEILSDLQLKQLSWENWGTEKLNIWDKAQILKLGKIF